MEQYTEKEAQALVEHWLSNHPDRVQNRRHQPESLANWKQAAVHYLVHGNPYDAEDILRWFATQAEGSSMEESEAAHHHR